MDLEILKVGGSLYPFSRKVLGWGSFGVVFETTRQTALKIVFIDHDNNLERYKRKEKSVRREYEALRGKQHPNIITMKHANTTALTTKEFDFIFGDRRQLFDKYPRLRGDALIDERRNYAVERGKKITAFCIEMELAGPTLKAWYNCDRVKNAELSSDLAVTKSMEKFRLYKITKVQARAAQEIVEGLKFLHTSGLLHRDLKPDNIMFSWTAQGKFRFPIKLVDFGLCRPISPSITDINNNLSLSNESLTSSPFNNPYQARGTTSANYGIKSELHSLGRVLYELFHPGHYSFERFDDLARNPAQFVRDHFILGNVLDCIERLTSTNSAIQTLALRDIRLIPRATEVHNFEDLRQALANAIPGQLIHLVAEEYEYWGSIMINTDGLVIDGGINKGRKTIFKAHMLNIDYNSKKARPPAVYISGNNCLLSNISLEVVGIEGVGGLGATYTGIKITGKANNLYKVCVKRATQSILISGNCNVLEKCKFIEADTGMIIKGEGNNIGNTELGQIFMFGIDLVGNYNRVVNANLTKLRNGIKLDNGATGNFLDSVKYTKDPNRPGDSVIAVWIRDGKDNKIVRMRVEGLNVRVGDVGLYTDNKSESTNVSDSWCGSVDLTGKGDTFLGVDFGHIFKARVENIVNLENCVASSAPQQFQRILKNKSQN